jgi:hypothetical protein
MATGATETLRWQSSSLNPENPDRDEDAEHGQAGDRPSRDVGRAVVAGAAHRVGSAGCLSPMRHDRLPGRIRKQTRAFSVASSFETRPRGRSSSDERNCAHAGMRFSLTLMVRSAATPRVSNHADQLAGNGVPAVRTSRSAFCST